LIVPAGIAFFSIISAFDSSVRGYAHPNSTSFDADEGSTHVALALLFLNNFMRSSLQTISFGAKLRDACFFRGYYISKRIFSKSN